MDRTWKRSKHGGWKVQVLKAWEDGRRGAPDIVSQEGRRHDLHLTLEIPTIPQDYAMDPFFPYPCSPTRALPPGPSAPTIARDDCRAEGPFFSKHFANSTIYPIVDFAHRSKVGIAPEHFRPIFFSDELRWTLYVRSILIDSHPV